LCVSDCFAEGVKHEISCLPSATDRPIQFYIFIVVVNVNLGDNTEQNYNSVFVYVTFCFLLNVVW